MLISWDKLPDEMKNDKVREYYTVLEGKKISIVVKRAFDVVVSLIMLVLLSWLFAILAIMIKIDSKGPVFFRQIRVTTGNRDFRIFKFRTMVNNADRMGSLVTTGNDMRITRVGAKIRKCRLDEIPQLINVLKGDMTFVGTRPEVRKYVDGYTDEMMATLLMPAGITSLASICYKDEDDIIDEYTAKGMSVDEAYVNEVLPRKMKYNLEYIAAFNFIYDIKLMINTVKSIF
ncbi:MAG: sugar transferase [Anaerovoracaceae bacterium]|nr:sugar transferase [Anaerovoracaceae bacterium]